MKRFRFFAFFLLTCIATAIYAQKPVAFCEKSTHFFKEVVETGGPVTHTFIIKNIGKGPLVLTQAEASCGCTTPAWTRKPIPAGQTGTVKVTFDPKGQPGSFFKTISVYNNSSKKPLMLYIRGTVVAAKEQ